MNHIIKSIESWITEDVILQNDLYPEGITNDDVISYYQKVKPNIISWIHNTGVTQVRLDFFDETEGDEIEVAEFVKRYDRIMSEFHEIRIIVPDNKKSKIMPVHIMSKNSPNKRGKEETTISNDIKNNLPFVKSLEYVSGNIFTTFFYLNKSYDVKFLSKSLDDYLKSLNPSCVCMANNTTCVTRRIKGTAVDTEVHGYYPCKFSITGNGTASVDPLTEKNKMKIK